MWICKECGERFIEPAEKFIGGSEQGGDEYQDCCPECKSFNIEERVAEDFDKD